MKLVLLDQAQDELVKARDYYLQHGSARIATSFLEQFNSTAALILARPELGRQHSPRMRSIALNHFPYSIIYRVTPETIIVQAVAHQRRRPGYWAKRR